VEAVGDPRVISVKLEGANERTARKIQAPRPVDGGQILASSLNLDSSPIQQTKSVSENGILSGRQTQMLVERQDPISLMRQSVALEGNPGTEVGNRFSVVSDLHCVYFLIN
jgi:hypothetical protein